MDSAPVPVVRPFRAFVADKLPDDQRTTGFVMQSFFIGIGASLANALPIMLRWAGVTGETASGIPLTVYYSFQLGAGAFLLAVLWTVVTTREYPPEDMEAFLREKRERRGVGTLLGEIGRAIVEMPRTMRQLAVVQVFTWLGLFCMWMFFVPATARHVFGAVDAQSVRPHRRRTSPAPAYQGNDCRIVMLSLRSQFIASGSAMR